MSIKVLSIIGLTTVLSRECGFDKYDLHSIYYTYGGRQSDETGSVYNSLAQGAGRWRAYVIS